LDTLFLGATLKKSLHAYKIVSLSNETIVNAIATTPNFREIAFQVLSSNSVNEASLAKVCTINMIILAKADPAFSVLQYQFYHYYLFQMK
jgi:hypothetical protein